MDKEKLILLMGNGGGEVLPTELAIPTGIDVVEEITTLLFKSRFETDVSVLVNGTGGWPTGYQGITGNDEGFDWGQQLIPSYGDGGAAPVDPFTVILSGIHVIEGGSTPTDIVENDLVTIVGHEGTSTTVLRQFKYSDSNEVYDGPGSQTPFQINNIVNIPNKTYIRFWFKSDVSEMSESLDTEWMMIWQYKSGLYDGDGDNNGYRTSLTLVHTVANGFYWTLVGNKGNAAIPGNEFYAVTTTAEGDPTMGFNFGGWNLIEVLVEWSGADTGQVIFKLNNVEVFNRQNQRTLGPDDIYISFLTFWQFYGPVLISGTNWIDDVEIWGDDPQIPYIAPIDAHGPELVIEGDFSNGGAAWTIGISSAVINEEVVVTNGGTEVDVVRQVVTEIGKFYKVEFKIKDYVEGGIYVRRPSIGSSAASSNGVHVFDNLEASGTILILRSIGTITNLTLDNVSVKEVL